jgi:endonuclease/exonuclease/phosphatase family metal-dependent hydrolase
MPERSSDRGVVNWRTPCRALVAATLASMPSMACAPVHMQLDPALSLCRTVLPSAGPPVRWIAPFGDADRRKLRSWCDAVGPVALHDPGPRSREDRRPVTIVSWNMAVGKGDLSRLLADVRAGAADAEVILLLQEAYRARTPPAACADGSGRAKALGRPRASGSEDIIDLATRLHMHAVYAPSMRNGTDCGAEPREDRGNAILSTLPISEVAVVELPFAQQRRAAVAARIGGSIGVISTHFDTLRGHTRMAHAIAQAVTILGWTGPVVVAGDFNSTLPIGNGLPEMKRHFTELDCGNEPTHWLGRLDHMFIATGNLSFPCRTGAAAQRHGSDHRPLIADFPGVAASGGR